MTNMNRVRVDIYLKDVLTYLDRNHPSKIASVILFGSFTGEQKRNKSVSDVDLLIVVENDCSNYERDKIVESLGRIERQHFGHTITPKNPLIRGLQQATGMFVNNFVCYYDQFIRRDFNAVFGLNRFVTCFLAPSNSVWISLRRQHKVLYGRNLFKEWDMPLKMKKHDIVKSLMMNTLLSFCTVFVGCLHRESMKFSMEAMKWSLFTWRNYHDLEVTRPNDVMKEYLRLLGYNDKVLIQAALFFVRFRNTGTIEKKLTILALLFVIKIHLKLMTGNKKC